MTASSEPTVRPRRLAHQVVVPPPEWGDVSLRHLTRHYLADALGLYFSTDGFTSLALGDDKVASRLYMERLGRTIFVGHLALLHVALSDGLSGHDAALWARARAGEEGLGEWLWECALRFDVDPEEIRPYGLLPDRRGPDHAWCRVCRRYVKAPADGWTLDDVELARCTEHAEAAPS